MVVVVCFFDKICTSIVCLDDGDGKMGLDLVLEMWVVTFDGGSVLSNGGSVREVWVLYTYE